MPFTSESHDPSAVEACLDEMGEALAGIDHYPPALLAVALRVHMESLLQALLQAQLCTQAEVRDYLRELEREVLQYVAS
ncbi:MAG TPA: hypothetical protein VL994_05870 [Steroidobacteraceae bacterium]|nr:hypothetical protein [Steroidobacteraceae bacterium]